MKHHRFSQRSIKNFEKVRPNLVNLCERGLMLSPYRFENICGARTKEDQAEKYAQGRTKPGKIITWTLNSRHIPSADGWANAVDLLAYDESDKPTYEWKYYEAINEALQTAALEHKEPLIWGGTWKNRDGMHWELDRRKYP